MLYDEQLLVDYLSSRIPYPVELGNALMNDQTDIMEDETRVYISHLRQVPLVKSTEDLVENGYFELDVPMLVYTQIQLHCPRAGWHSIWNEIEEALKDFTPFPGDGNYSNLSYREGAVVAFPANKVIFVAEYSLQTPRIS